VINFCYRLSQVLLVQGHKWLLFKFRLFLKYSFQLKILQWSFWLCQSCALQFRFCKLFLVCAWSVLLNCSWTLLLSNVQNIHIYVWFVGWLLSICVRQRNRQLKNWNDVQQCCRVFWLLYSYLSHCALRHLCLSCVSYSCVYNCAQFYIVEWSMLEPVCLHLLLHYGMLQHICFNTCSIFFLYVVFFIMPKGSG